MGKQPGRSEKYQKYKKGDLAFIYHTGDEKQIIGIGEITSDSYPDPKSDDEKLVVFDIKPVENLMSRLLFRRLKQTKSIPGLHSYESPVISCIGSERILG